MDLCNIGSASWEEQPGMSYDIDDSGGATLKRNYRGPKDTLDAFLDTIPEGTADTEYTDLLRLRKVTASKGDSWGTCTLTFAGQSFGGSQPTPVKVKKTRTSRTAHIRNETSTGDPIDDTGGLAQSDTLTIKYGTALNSVEYVTASEPDEPGKETAADLPSTLNNAIRILDCSPSIALTSTQYLGGGFQAPEGLTAKIAAADYKVVAVCVQFDKDFDGVLWRVREDWVALIEDETT